MTRLAAVTAVLTFCTIALLSWTTSIAQAQPGTNYCNFGHNASLFLVDQTTLYDETDKRVIIDSVSAVVGDLGIGDRIVVATINEHYSVSRRIVDECKPGCPQTGNFIGDILGGCRSVIAMQDDQQFRVRLRANLRPLVQTQREAPFSDITGTVAQWTQHPPGGRAFTRVYLFSDMLENSQAMPWREFRNLDSAQAMTIVRRYGLVPNVRNAEVRIVGFGRLHDPGRPPLPADLDLRLREFWRGYFAAGMARTVTFEGAITTAAGSGH